MMQRLIIQPLEQEHIVIELRTTSLEKMLQCPYNMQFAKYVESDKQKFGKIVHKWLQTYRSNKEKNYEYAYTTFSQWLEWEELRLFKEYMQISHDIPDIVCNELELKMEVEYGTVLYVIKWIADCIHYDGSISDIKTWKAEWKMEDLFDKLQPYFYTYMANADKFTYYIFTKHKKVRLQVLEIPIDRATSEEKIIDTIKEYHSYLTSLDRAKKTNKYCRFCQFAPTCFTTNQKNNGIT